MASITTKVRTARGLFPQYLAKTLPLAFDESMSYYECLCSLISIINNNAEATTEVQQAMTTLQEYVDNYFKNLSVQTEIDNKLDALVADGTLSNIINQEIFGKMNDSISELEANDLTNLVVIGDSYTSLSNSTWAEDVSQQLN